MTIALAVINGERGKNTNNNVTVSGKELVQSGIRTCEPMVLLVSAAFELDRGKRKCVMSIEYGSLFFHRS